MDEISGLAIIKLFDKNTQNTMMFKTEIYMIFANTGFNK